jgi:hypothetical protein
MTGRCKICGDSFKLCKEDEELVSEGYAEMPDECPDCVDMYQQVEDYQEYSDADPGL